MARSIDLAAVRAARRNLADLAGAHPELTQGAPWADSLEELDDMTTKDVNTRQREWRERQRAAGKQQFQLWFDPNTVARLNALLAERGYGPGQKREGMAAIIAEAVARMKSMKQEKSEKS